MFIVLMLPFIASRDMGRTTLESLYLLSCRITFWGVVTHIPIVLIVVFVAIKLSKSNKILSFSLWKLFNFQSGIIKNFEFLPIRLKFLGPIFILLIIINLPAVVYMEEYIFRNNTQSWLDGIIWSFLFGLAHFIGGIPLGACIAISLAGLWFTELYFIGGLDAAILGHFTYDVIILASVFVELVIRHIRLLFGIDDKFFEKL
jgi:hypothetical protein